jgi:HD-GYP domain-containing protein (c-di-GMP phosphodiesterase class II)
VVTVRLSEVVAALSHALDLTGGQAVGHARRTAVIGMRLGVALGLSAEDRAALMYALLLKDAGCSTNAAPMSALFGSDDLTAKADKSLIDHTRPLELARFVLRTADRGAPLHRRLRQAGMIAQRSRGQDFEQELLALRCERGADIALMLDLPTATAAAIGTAFEHWNGRGTPAGLAGDQIPLLGRIVAVAQRAELFHHATGYDGAARMVRRRRGRWFDPQVADAFLALGREVVADVHRADAVLATLEPEDRVVTATDARLDRLAEAFARVIDAKSPYTARHSGGVADIAVAIAETLGHPPNEVRNLRRAALLHDIGKLGVSNRVLDKPGRLDAAEWEQVRRHPRLTYDILRGVDAFRPLAAMAAAHHERLDGSGYHLGLDARSLSPLARILAVADVAEALSAERPYRPALAPGEVLAIMRRDVPGKLDARAFAALEGALPVVLRAA